MFKIPIDRKAFNRATSISQMLWAVVQDPLFVPQILKHVGPGPFVDW